jgi:hypothetical protein
LVDPRRVELGYDYCTRDSCQRACLERVPLVRVTVNKAADQFVRADSWARSGGSERSYSAGAFADDPTPVSSQPLARSYRSGRKRLPSELELLREAEAGLDRELEAADRRFLVGEVTAAEMKRVQNAAIDRFNARVAGSNIRYRSLERKRV